MRVAGMIRFRVMAAAALDVEGHVERAGLLEDQRGGDFLAFLEGIAAEAHEHHVQPARSQRGGRAGRHPQRAGEGGRGAGPGAVVWGGARIVGRVETVGGGVVAPGTGLVTRTRYDNEDIILQKGEEMGRFRLGSTVVMVMPKGSVEWNQDEVPGKLLRMGKSFGRLQNKL